MCPESKINYNAMQPVDRQRKPNTHIKNKKNETKQCTKQNVDSNNL